jgi:hypothetical protein
MYTTWFSKPSDLGFIRNWSRDRIPNAYASGRSIHLVIWLGDEGELTTTDTPYGRACGRTYALSSAFLDDARQLAQIFAGRADGPSLYVTMFSEFQTYTCDRNAWAATPEATAYYKALKAQYTSAMQIFHSTAPNAKVSLGWGGWQARFDDPGKGGGKSMFQYFDDVMRASDFESFQAMQSDTNVADIVAMTTILGRYGPVMVAHFKPDNGSQATWTDDLEKIFTDSYIKQVTGLGLFAFSFMDKANMASAAAVALVRDGLLQYGRLPN